MGKFKTQVLIVGAGPTGLMAANQLMRFGIDFIIVDTKEGPTLESRAILTTARSLEIYEQMGLSDEVVNNGKVMTSFKLMKRGKVRGTVEVGEIGKGMTAFGFILAFEQFKNEKILSDQLDKNGQSVWWSTTYIKMLEYKETVRAIVNRDGKEIEIESEYIIGAEGARSRIRHELDFTFKGGTYEQKFFVVDTEVKSEIPLNDLMIAPGKKNFCAIMPLTGDDNKRIIGTLPRKFSNKEDVTFKDIQDVVKNTLGMPISFEKVNWFSIYKLHHRAVDHFSEDRVFLAGDAAHIHSPAGGQGMNTGLQDAYNLCWKLAMVLKGHSPQKLLKTYNEERMPFAKWLLKFTDRGFTILTSQNIFVKFFRTFVALPMGAIMMKKDRLRRYAFPTIAQIGYSYQPHSLALDASDQNNSFNAGDRFPYFPEDNLYHKLNNPGFHLIHIGPNEMDVSLKDSIREEFSGPLFFVEDQNIEKWKKLGVNNEMFILVRPDNYITFISDLPDKEQLNDYLKKVGLKA